MKETAAQPDTRPGLSPEDPSLQGFWIETELSGNEAGVQSPMQPPVNPYPPKALVYSGQPEKPAEKKTGLHLAAAAAAVVLLAGIGIGLALLLGGSGTNPRKLAHDAVEIVLYDQDAEEFLERCVPIEDEDIEDERLQDMEELLDLLSDTGFRLLSSEVTAMEKYDADSEFQERLEEFFDYDGKADVFHEYAVKIRYDTYDSEEETFVWVILGRIDGQWYLVKMDLSRLMSELEQ